MITHYENLYIGLKISQEELREWSLLGDNRYYNCGWQSMQAYFYGDRKIISFHYIQGKNCFLIEGTSKNLFINAEGLSEFLGLKSKSKPKSKPKSLSLIKFI